MIEIRTLGYLNVQRQKDAKVLFRGNRYAASVYLMGYAIEYALKRRICQNLQFDLGFPELNSEFVGYGTQVAFYNSYNSRNKLNNLRQIKNHNLPDLLFFSGIEPQISFNYKKDWRIVRDWNPEDRYKIRRFSTKKCKAFLKSARAILNQLN